MTCCAPPSKGSPSCSAANSTTCARIGGAPAALQLAGGGSRHPAWRQLLADALAVPLFPAGNGSLTAQGAALIAATATGLVPDASAAGRSDQQRQGVRPASQQASENYQAFRSASSQQNH